MPTPEEKATPEWKAKNAAGKTFKEARASWRDAKDRIRQIKQQIAGDGLENADRRALKEELKGLKEALPAMAERTRSTKATWQALKDGYATPAD